MYLLSFINTKELAGEERADLQALFLRSASFMAAFEAAIRAEITLAGLADRERGYTVDSEGNLVTVTIDGTIDEEIEVVISRTVGTVSDTEPDWQYRPPEILLLVTSDEGGGPPSSVN